MYWVDARFLLDVRMLLGRRFFYCVEMWIRGPQSAFEVIKRDNIYRYSISQAIQKHGNKETYLTRSYTNDIQSPILNASPRTSRLNPIIATPATSFGREVACAKLHCRHRRYILSDSAYNTTRRAIELALI
jgi:hypothetical protein